MSHVSRWSFIMLALVVALAAPATSSAQFGGLVKKKLAEKAVKEALPTPPGTASATPAAAVSTPSDAERKARQDAWNHPVAITSAGLDNFVKAIKVENAERAKFIAAAPATSTFGKWNAYQAEKAKCASDRAKDDSASNRLQSTMMAEASAGHGEKIQMYSDSMQKIGLAGQARDQRCNALARPQFTDEDYAAVRAQENIEEAAGAAAGGFDPLVYSRLKERVIAYLLMPSSWKPSGYSADELHAIDARKVELRPLLGRDFNTSGQRNSLGS